MKKQWAKFSVLPVLGAFLFFGFSTKEQAFHFEILTGNLPAVYTVAKQKNSIWPKDQLPRLGNSYIGFREALGFKESRGDYGVINQFGYLGKYQFGKSTLEMIGIYNTDKFLNSPVLQEAAFYANASRNKWILQDEIKKYAGKTINGVKITESGILAAAHLAGPGGVGVYLRSGGTRYFSDAFGTTITYYLKKFAGYNTSFVIAERNAKAVI